MVVVGGEGGRGVVGRDFLVDFSSPLSVVFKRTNFPSILVNSFQKCSLWVFVVGTTVGIFLEGGFGVNWWARGVAILVHFFFWGEFSW